MKRYNFVSINLNRHILLFGKKITYPFWGFKSADKNVNVHSRWNNRFHRKNASAFRTETYMETSRTIPELPFWWVPIFLTKPTFQFVHNLRRKTNENLRNRKLDDVPGSSLYTSMTRIFSRLILRLLSEHLCFVLFFVGCIAAAPIFPFCAGSNCRTPRIVSYQIHSWAGFR